MQDETTVQYINGFFFDLLTKLVEKFSLNESQNRRL